MLNLSGASTFIQDPAAYYSYLNTYFGQFEGSTFGGGGGSGGSSYGLSNYSASMGELSDLTYLKILQSSGILGQPNLMFDPGKGQLYYWQDGSSEAPPEATWSSIISPDGNSSLLITMWRVPSIDAGKVYIDVPQGHGGMTWLPENNFIKYSIEGTSIWAGTIQTGFAAAKVLQRTVSTWIKGAKVLGKTTNLLGVASIGYDFATGTANSSTVADGLVMVGGAAAIFFGGVALAPWVAGAGVLYGIGSIAGGESWLNKNIDISGYLNSIKTSKP